MDDRLTKTPLYRQGSALMQAGRFTDAADLFGDMLEASVADVGDELAPCLAPVYFQVR